MIWTFTPQITGLTTYRLPYDPVDARELTKFEGILINRVGNFIYELEFKTCVDAFEKIVGWSKC